MPRKKKVSEDAMYHLAQGDSALADPILDEDEDALTDDKFDRLHDGLMLMPAGGAVRMRPSGHGPDSDEFSYGYD